MRVIRDTREQSPLDFSRYEAVVEPGTLEVGDYAPAGLGHLCAVERKSLADLVASLTWERERFEREMRRARGLDAFAVVIEGSLGQVRGTSTAARPNPMPSCRACAPFPSATA